MWTAKVIRAARTMAGPYGGIVEFLALTGQRREEVAQSTWDEFDLKTCGLDDTQSTDEEWQDAHCAVSRSAIAVLARMPKYGDFVFTIQGIKPFRRFSAAKRKLDALSGLPGGGCTICDALACQEWLDLASPHTLRTRCSITNRGQFQG